MENSEQINLKLSKNLAEAARRYAEIYGYRNIQELANESIREKVFENNEFDETFSDKEIELIDSLIEKIIEKKDFGTEEDLNKALKNDL
jgi:3-dehydroquinate dehydratase